MSFFAGVRAQERAEFLNEPVALHMPEGVVGLLQVVQVEEADRQRQVLRPQRTRGQR